jgi:regulatory protein
MPTDKNILREISSYCTFRERCTKEVRDKLLQLKVKPEEVAEYLKIMQQENFLNEHRFAHAYVNDKFRFNHWGKVKIRQQLKTFQIEDELIETALNSIDAEDYNQTISRIIERFLPKTKGLHAYQKQQKILKHCYGKGFEPEVVSRLIK